VEVCLGPGVAIDLVVGDPVFGLGWEVDADRTLGQEIELRTAFGNDEPEVEDLVIDWQLGVGLFGKGEEVAVVE